MSLLIFAVVVCIILTLAIVVARNIPGFAQPYQNITICIMALVALLVIAMRAGWLHG